MKRTPSKTNLKPRKISKSNSADLPEEYCCHLFTVEKKHLAIIWNSKNQIKRLYLPQDSRTELRQKILRDNNNTYYAQPNPKIASLIRQIKNYFSGKAFNFVGFEYDLRQVNEFARQVLAELVKVPPGRTVSYGELAHRAGKARAARAVGRAVANNPVPLLIPCHRVIKSDGSPGGFSGAGGCEQKLKMLEIEGVKIRKAEKPKKCIKSAKTYSEIVRTGVKKLCKADPEMAIWIKKLPPFELNLDNKITSFQALLEAIVYQQLTGKAAGTIYTRLLQLFGCSESVSPLDIIRAQDSELRKSGLSGPKILAIRDLAEKTQAGLIPEFATLEEMSDAEIIQCLTRVRGIGRWTAEMLLIFRLGRLDVLAADDYGLKKGFAVLRKLQQLPSSKQLQEEGKCWSPYRTIASWYLWRIADFKK